jgi:endonuclease YncB( thermonuclease family)
LIAPGTEVTITTFRDSKEKYGRYLAKIIMPDGSDFSTSMIDANHAKPYFGGSRK